MEKLIVITNTRTEYTTLPTNVAELKRLLSGQGIDWSSSNLQYRVKPRPGEDMTSPITISSNADDHILPQREYMLKVIPTHMKQGDLSDEDWDILINAKKEEVKNKFGGSTIPYVAPIQQTVVTKEWYEEEVDDDENYDEKEEEEVEDWMKF